MREVFPLLLYYHHLSLFYYQQRCYTNRCIINTCCYYITDSGIIPTAVLWSPVVTTLPIAMLYQSLYYQHRLLLYYQVRYFPYCCIINTCCVLLVNFLRYSADMSENLGIAERFLISIIVV